jgi:hypothetical protein
VAFLHRSVTSGEIEKDRASCKLLILFGVPDGI